MYFYNARYYDPSLGRFIQADTIVPDPMNPQQLNRYTYVLNNPLRYTDPSGDQCIDFEGHCVTWEQIMQYLKWPEEWGTPPEEWWLNMPLVPSAYHGELPALAQEVLTRGGLPEEAVESVHVEWGTRRASTIIGTLQYAAERFGFVIPGAVAIDRYVFLEAPVDPTNPADLELLAEETYHVLQGQREGRDFPIKYWMEMGRAAINIEVLVDVSGCYGVPPGRYLRESPRSQWLRFDLQAAYYNNPYEMEAKREAEQVRNMFGP